MNKNFIVFSEYLDSLKEYSKSDEMIKIALVTMPLVVPGKDYEKIVKKVLKRNLKIMKFIDSIPGARNLIITMLCTAIINMIESAVTAAPTAGSGILLQFLDDPIIISAIMTFFNTDAGEAILNKIWDAFEKLFELEYEVPSQYKSKKLVFFPAANAKLLTGLIQKVNENPGLIISEEDSQAIIKWLEKYIKNKFNDLKIRKTKKE